jgi:Icc protein
MSSIPMTTSFYFLQLSDTHIMADTQAEYHGVRPYACLDRLIEQMCQLDPGPAFVIFTGDLINDDDPRSYDHLKRLTDRVPFPCYFAVGNHDLRRPFRQRLLGETPPSVEPYYYTFEIGEYRCIVLDSLVEGEVGGAIDAGQLVWLENLLGAEPYRPCIVFVHHPPAPTGVDWLDQHAIENGAALLDVLAAHGRVLRVFFGHVHMPVQLTVRGVHCTSVPSTCYQFGDAIVTPKVMPGPPGYGVVHVRKGRVSSRIQYVQNS